MRKRVPASTPRQPGHSRQANRQHLGLGAYQARVADRLRAWQHAGFARRLWQKDPTLWAPSPQPEIADRLGWLNLPEMRREQVDDLTAFATEIKIAGFRHVVVLGMGGSSLAPDVFRATFEPAAGYPVLVVLDSTHPAAVRAVEAQVDLARTLFIVSSKSGTTVEPLSFFRYFWARVAEGSRTPGHHFVAITDPGTPLEHLAHDRGFRRVFQAPPDVGGRYSALTVFGLVPAALMGVDLQRLLDRARRMAKASAPSVPEADNPTLVLGAALGELTLVGRDKVTFETTPGLAAFPAWVEQLIAESTGKKGKGIIPIVGEAPASPHVYGPDRFFVHLYLDQDDAVALDARGAALEASGHPVARIQLTETADLGQEFFRWECGVAAAGAVLGINPFDQPDVELAKDLARQAMGRDRSSLTVAGPNLPVVSVQPGTPQDAVATALRSWMNQARPGDYVALQAYLEPSAAATAALERVRLLLRDRLALATTVGYGPRFLHSTGQLHKGGPSTGLFLQLTDDPTTDLAVPESDYTFGALLRAQALGDLLALQQRGRRVLRVALGTDSALGLRHVTDALQS